MTARYVALLRGVNVGGGNTRVPMPVLRDIVARAGHTEIATLINSGNVVFTAAGEVDVAALVESIRVDTGVPTSMVLLGAERLKRIAEKMPFEGDPSRLLITFMTSVPADLDVPQADAIAPEAIAIGEYAIYQHLPDGVSKSRIPASFARGFPPEATARNLRTVRRLIDML